MTSLLAAGDTQALHDKISRELQPIGAANESKWIVEEIEKRLARDPSLRAQSIADSIVARRLKHEPLAYILGEWSFRRYDFFVGPGVLIPRPETEEFVEYALSFTEKSEHLMEKLFGEEGLSIVDAGAGSGCIGLSFVADLLKDLREEAFDMAELSKNIRLTFVERSAEALSYLQKNIVRLAPHLHNTQITLVNKSWKDWPAAPFDLLLSNPPYLSAKELAGCDASVRDFEPATALVPLDVDEFPDASGPYRDLIKLAESNLLPGGYTLFELGQLQPAWLKGLIPSWKNFDNLRLFKDMAQKERFFVMRKKDHG